MTFRHGKVPKHLKTWALSVVSDVFITCLSTFTAARLEDLYDRLVYGPLEQQLKEEDERKAKSNGEQK